MNCHWINISITTPAVRILLYRTILVHQDPVLRMLPFVTASLRVVRQIQKTAFHSTDFALKRWKREPVGRLRFSYQINIGQTTRKSETVKC